MKHLTQEEKETAIREYAFRWWEIRMKYGINGTPEGDWAKAEVMVEAEYRIENPR